MSKQVPTSLKDALKQFEAAKGVVAAEAEKARAAGSAASSAADWSPQVELWGRVPPIEKLDATLGTLKKCKCVAGPERGNRRGV